MRYSVGVINLNLPERVTRKIIVDKGGCWLWQGACNSAGYGHLVIGSRTDSSRKYVKVHRFIYECLVGPIGSRQLDHLCRVHNCVNPKDLEPAIPTENIRRGVGHGKETHCPRGHTYDKENTYTNRGKRFCRACRRERNSEIEARRRC